MESKSIIKKRRTTLSRLFTGGLFVLILVSDSLWETKGLWSTVIFLTGVVLVGLGTVGRLWCLLYISGYKGHEANTLIMTGPYSICRNPLYFFSFLGGIGIGLTTETLTIPTIILIAFALYYVFVINVEQKHLLAIHTEAFKDYCKTTPAFFPSLKLLNEPEEYIVRPKAFRKSVFDALWFVWMIGIVELIEAIHETGLIPTVIKLY